MSQETPNATVKYRTTKDGQFVWPFRVDTATGKLIAKPRNPAETIATAVFEIAFDCSKMSDAAIVGKLESLRTQVMEQFPNMRGTGYRMSEPSQSNQKDAKIDALTNQLVNLLKALESKGISLEDLAETKAA